LLDELSSSGERHTRLDEISVGILPANSTFSIQVAAVVFSGYHKDQGEAWPFHGNGNLRSHGSVKCVAGKIGREREIA
jgi:hypothetical protein